MSDGAESRSEAVTHGVRVSVRARFVPERSNPGDGEWFFAYSIEITNESDRTVQLLSRHWIITDADGKVEEVRGPGVVGQQPILGPGQSFEYTSACPLITSFGVMQGTVSDGHARRRSLRHRDRAVLASRALRRQLASTRPKEIP